MATDLTGRTFGQWTVLGPVCAPHAKTKWACRCACGIEADVRADHLLRGTSRSCGRRHLQGTRVGTLDVLAPAPNVLTDSRSAVKGYTAWTCHCGACGRACVIPTYALTGPHPASHCGCRTLRPAPANPPIAAPALPRTPERTTTAQEFLDREHDLRSPLGRVRRVDRPVDDEDGGRVMFDFDPFVT